MRLPVLVLITIAGGVYAQIGRLTKTIGVYHWGAQPARPMSEGVAEVASLGGRLVRVTMSPRHYVDYGRGTTCDPALSLTALAQEPDVRSALAMPGIDTYIITAYDAVSFGDCARHHYLRPAFYTPENTGAILREYSDFTLYLYETYSTTHKRFILSNWESDNAIYCGNANGYATQADTRAKCDALYPTFYGNASADESFTALRKWFEVRQQGVADGRARAAAAGLGGSRVFCAPEISIVRGLHEAGLKSVLYDVLPHIMFDYVSYSSWESINRPNAPAALIADLETIQNVLGTGAIIVGEVGYSRTAWGDCGAAARIESVIAAALDWGVPFVIRWNLYDSGGEELGLFDRQGTLTALGVSYREGMSPSKAAGCGPASVVAVP